VAIQQNRQATTQRDQTSVTTSAERRLFSMTRLTCQMRGYAQIVYTAPLATYCQPPQS
jgi:hypothetical protein